MDFSGWITQKYIEWQAEHGARKTINDFAEYIGVSQQTISVWMNGKGTPSGKNLGKISSRLGYEVYDVMDIPRPMPQDLDPSIEAIARFVMVYPPEMREKIRIALEKTMIQAVRENIQNDDQTLVILGDNIHKMVRT